MIRPQQNGEPARKRRSLEAQSIEPGREDRRVEYGDAIVKPVSLVSSDGAIVPADTPAFDEKLRKLVGLVAHRRRQIEKIEKDEIGAIIRKMTSHDVELRALERNTQLAAPEREAQEGVIKASAAALQKDYEALAVQAKSLRTAQTRDFPNYRLATGEERKEPAGNHAVNIGEDAVYAGVARDIRHERTGS